MSAFSNLQSNLEASLSTLTGRERRLVTVAFLGAIALIIFAIVFTFGRQANTISLRTSTKLKQLGEIQTLASGYGAAKAAQEAAERQLAASNVRLPSFLEEKAQGAGLELPSISPRADVALEGTKIVESSVDLMLNEVRIDRLLEFIRAIEAGPGTVKVSHMHLEPRGQTENTSARLTISSYHLKN
jgi:general secretion pathway protein M